MPGVFDLAAKISVRGAEAAAAALRRVKNESKAVKTGFKQMGQIGASAKQALTGVAIMGAGAAVAVGGMAKSALSFENQMGTVASLIGGRAKPEFADLESFAKQLGASTVFSATQAGEGIEIMTRAGFDAKQVMGGLRGILNAAAAEGLSLATATDVVSGVIRGFGRDAKETTDVADALAYTSAKTNTNIAEVGEAFRYAAGQAHTAKLSYQETAAALGVLANATLKGSVGGTSFANMLLKMSKPSKKAQAILRQYNVQLVHSKGAQKGMLLPMGDIVSQFVEIGKKQPTVLKNMNIMSELFGIRGAKAMQAFIAQEQKEPGLLKKMTKGLMEVTDASRKTSFAQEMAEERLKTVQGQLILLKSALEGFSIEVFSSFLPAGQTGVKQMGRFIQAVTLWMMTMDKAKRTKAMEALGLSSATIKKAKDFADGVKAGLQDVKNAFRSFYETALKPLGVTFANQGQSATKSIAQLVTKIVAGMAIAGPALLALAPVIMTLKGTIGMLGGAMKLVFSPFGKYVAVAALLVDAFGKGDTFGEKLKNTIKSIGDYLKPLVSGLVKIAKMLGPGGTLAAIMGAGIAYRGAKAGLRGIAARLARRGGKLGGIAGTLLGGAGGGGLPVYVTNIGEMGMGAGSVVGDALTSGAKGGWLSRLGTAIAGGLRGIPAALGGGAFTATGGRAVGAAIPGVAAGGATMVAKAVPVVAAGAAGYALGTYLDKKFKLSDRISTLAVKNSLAYQLEHAKTQIHIQKVYNEGVMGQAKQLLAMQQKFGSIGVGGERVAITRAMAETRLLNYMQRMGFTQEQIRGYMASIQPILAQIPKTADPKVQLDLAKSRLKDAQDSMYRALRKREAEQMTAPLGGNKETNEAIKQAQANIDLWQKQIDQLSKQVIQITNKVVLDGKVVSSTVDKVKRNEGMRSGAGQEGKTAPTNDIQS